jgi:hypothetical protein
VCGGQLAIPATGRRPGVPRQTVPASRTPGAQQAATLRASINVAFPGRPTGDRRTSYHATDECITIGTPASASSGLRRQLARIGRNRGGWTITEDLN